MAGDGVAQNVRVTIIILAWMVISISLIMYNKWLLSFAHFGFPFALTSMHQLFAAMMAHAVCGAGLQTPPKLTFDQVISLIIPISVCSALSLALSNQAMVYISVPFMQMLKAAIPTFSYVIGISVGLEMFAWRLLGVVIWIGAGVAIASFGEIDFVLHGFIIALVGLVVEAARLVLSQRLLQGQDIKFNAITGIYYQAPISFIALFVPFMAFEFHDASVVMGQIPGHLVANACIAALLNVASYMVLKETSAVTYGICGQVKDWLNILIAIPVFGTSLSPIQPIGYGLAVLGVFYYKRLRTVIAKEVADAERARTDDDEAPLVRR
ncbi:triose-phosphate transporter family-domain-containing protein [Pavlovales sp. CCMP2436]|nr:triose-phosphate transporter family-domain-containing protein [Pavlovales sp. CCMP2436]